MEGFGSCQKNSHYSCNFCRFFDLHHNNIATVINKDDVQYDICNNIDYISTDGILHIDVCVDNHHNLFFMANGNVIQNIHCKIRNGKIKLNFQKYDYIFALASKRCSCIKQKKCDRFQFQVSFQTKRFC